MYALLTTLVYLPAHYLSKSGVNDKFPLDYLRYHNETGFTDECWVENFLEQDKCKNQGFCDTLSEDGSGTQCNCFYGYTGDSCELFLKAASCDQHDCGFAGIQGECVMGKDDLAICYCYSGWTGDDCSEQVAFSERDSCAGVMCNDRGTCAEDNSKTQGARWSCVCDSGWGGEDCGVMLESCGAHFLLDIFSRLATVSGDTLSASECAYSKPTVFSDAWPSLSDPDSFSFCICSTLWLKFLNDDYEVTVQTCNMDDYRKLPFFEEASSYCPVCDEKEDDIMETVLTSKSDTCYHFVYRRLQMPLYWRSIWKCGCVQDIGTTSTTETIVNCPFTQHTATSDYISYENCVAGKVCKWSEMYRYFEEDFSFIDLESSVSCKKWMESWVFTIPGEQRFEEMDDSFCPCLDALKAFGSGLDSILDCIPVTFHQLTMLDLYDQICYDPLVPNHECLNYIGYVAIQLGQENYTAGSSCYSAIDLASVLTSQSDNLKDLMCDCLVPLFSSSVPFDDSVFNALSCVGDEFSMDLCECQDYKGDDCFAIPYVKENKAYGRPYRTVSTSTMVTTTFSTSSTSESSWKIVSLVEIPLFGSFSLLAFFLRRRKQRING